MQCNVICCSKLGLGPPIPALQTEPRRHSVKCPSTFVIHVDSVIDVLVASGVLGAAWCKLVERSVLACDASRHLALLHPHSTHTVVGVGEGIGLFVLALSPLGLLTFFLCHCSTCSPS